MNKKGFSIIEALSAAAVLITACVYIFSLSSVSSRASSRCAEISGNIWAAQGYMEKAMGTAFADLASSESLAVVQTDEDTKVLHVVVNGYEIRAIRSKHE